MIWVQRLVAVVFAVGVVTLAVFYGGIAWRAEGVPTMPIFMGLMGVIVLILLAGACLAMISVAQSARRAADALQRMARQGGALPVQTDSVVPFSDSGLATPKPTTRRLVAER
ncbi:hypothetical protein [Paracoccus sp. (in: a-proteobacteria)]|uniref:hypothetical protein n=1 Tax=Paracoccus sp. TaxID=267 RepID=UPI0026DFE390|nr:hypothetical protein [Paracoccus sp. (in: a-proteobacteria)]MDO5648472.1 hypothetical protein [Paracoccus sp. (in: a-proteobacteria)]